MIYERISRTEMAARFKKHSRRLVAGSLSDAVRGCECFKVNDDAAIAINFEAPDTAFISLAVTNTPRRMLDVLEKAVSKICFNRKTYFHTKRHGLAWEAEQRGWLCRGLGGREFELSKVY